MHVFIIFCLLAAACAAELGYNYQSFGHHDTGVSDSGFDASGSSLNSFAPQDQFSSATNEAPSYGPVAEYEKEFYTYTTSEDDFNDAAASNQYDNSVQQRLRVVFIKGPEGTGLENAAVSLAKHASEQKTNIYVLQKQTDLGDLGNKLNIVNRHNNHKPEVHFVKYRTPEDAVNAQKAIQDQYDSLNGQSKSHDGGIAPVLNFASNLPAAATSYNNVPDSSEHAPTRIADKPSNTYLPASILRLFRL